MPLRSRHIGIPSFPNVVYALDGIGMLSALNTSLLDTTSAALARDDDDDDEGDDASIVNATGAVTFAAALTSDCRASVDTAVGGLPVTPGRRGADVVAAWPVDDDSTSNRVAALEDMEAQVLAVFDQVRNNLVSGSPKRYSWFGFNSRPFSQNR